MRRSDREVRNISIIKGILDDCNTCHLAMVDNGSPYVIPLSYAYVINNEGLTLYFHSAKEGRKNSILHANNAVCFEMCNEGELVIDAKTPCNSGYTYSSVHGFGSAFFIHDVHEKCSALSLLMAHQSNIEVDFTAEQADSVCVFKVISTDFTGKMKRRSSE